MDFMKLSPQELKDLAKPDPDYEKVEPQILLLSYKME